MSYQQRNRLTGDQLARELVSAEQLRLIITGETTESIKALTETAEIIGKQLARLVTTSQIRNIFGVVRMIEQDVPVDGDEQPLPIGAQRSLMMLRPKLAYQYGRVNGRDDDPQKAAMGALTTILSDAIALIGANRAYFKNFVDFFEAILAYHRRYGGKTS